MTIIVRKLGRTRTRGGGNPVFSLPNPRLTSAVSSASAREKLENVFRDPSPSSSNQRSSHRHRKRAAATEGDDPAGTAQAERRRGGGSAVSVRDGERRWIGGACSPCAGFTSRRLQQHSAQGGIGRHVKRHQMVFVVFSFKRRRRCEGEKRSRVRRGAGYATILR